MNNKKKKAIQRVKQNKVTQKHVGACPLHFRNEKNKRTGESVTVVSVEGNKGEEDFDQREIYTKAVQQVSGVAGVHLSEDVIERCAKALPDNKSKAENLNLVVEFLNEVKPKNVVEAMLYTQFLTMQEIGMTHLQRAEAAETQQLADFRMRTAVKFLNLQHSALDKLLKYKSGGEQKVVVQHVQVNDGGKAVVGNFEAGNRGRG